MRPRPCRPFTCKKYTVGLASIPKGGTVGSAKVVRVDDDGDANTYKVDDIQIKKPASGPLDRQPRVT
ncbi:hypothetical protein [Streptomyces sp. 142MFCol3.1]|uniref:hypothetical protein n=1 Tax=Streptomyces sp. 142MFCol3.1 TaxID=1172179 RepID=UPI000422D407|nr:hypothetical protein [Streptomyces sp. 142MFCol3.1]